MKTPISLNSLRQPYESLELLSFTISTTAMASLLLLLLVLLLQSFIVVPVKADYISYICGNTEDFDNNRTYSKHLNLLLSSLSPNASVTGFSKTMIGSVQVDMYIQTVCRGDLDDTTCRSCFSTAVSHIQELCPNSKEAVIWYDACQLRYSNQSFLNDLDVTSNNKVLMFNSQNVSANQLLRFETLTTALMGNLSDLAVRNSPRLLATGRTALTALDMIYGMVQCAQTLSAGRCRNCLQRTVDMITLEPMKGKMGARVLGMWCNLRYEFYEFYNSTSMLQLPSAPPPPSTLFPTNGSSKANITQPAADSSGGGIAL